MEGREADDILLSYFRNLCPGLLDERITAIGELNADILYTITAKSCSVISGNDKMEKYPNVLPKNIAVRHRLCTTLATIIKDAGYTGDIGYNQLLYPIESQTRLLLNWLVIRIPKRDEEIVPGTITNEKKQIRQDISESLLNWKKSYWIVPILKISFESSQKNSSLFRTVYSDIEKKQSFDSLFSLAKKENISIIPSLIEKYSILQCHSHQNNKYKNLHDPFKTSSPYIINNNYSINTQDKSISTLDTIISEQSIHSLSLSRLIRLLEEEGMDYSEESNLQSSSSLGSKHTVDAVNREKGLLAWTGKDTDDLLETEMKLLGEEVEALSCSVSALRRQLSVETQSRQEGCDEDALELARLNEKSAELEAEVLRKSQALQMMTDSAAVHLAALSAELASTQRRILDTSTKWNMIRQQLIDRIDVLRKSQLQRRIRCDQLAKENAELELEIPILLSDLADRRHKSAVLQQELVNQPKSLSRTQYTNRILEIISSLAKQDCEIERVVEDIRSVKKAIHSAGDALVRADAVAEEKIFKRANTAHYDPTMVQTYKLLTLFRTQFSALLESLDRGSALGQELRDMALKSEQEKERMTDNNTTIFSDLEQLKAENADMMKIIREASSDNCI